eukprot:3493675-Prymnesium_polylepis.1
MLSPSTYHRISARSTCRARADRSNTGACACAVAGANVSPTDRWCGTPLDDATRHGHAAVV